MQFKANAIEVPEDNPFRYDTLSREKHVKNIALLLKNISSPTVFAINAPWGQGKTTFLEMVRAYLKTYHQQHTIYFSAWETDFVADPLVAFLGEMDKAFGAIWEQDSPNHETWQKAKKAGAYILKKSVPAIVKMLSYGILDTEKFVEDRVAKLFEEFSGDLIDEYQQVRDAITIFKENVAKILAKRPDSDAKLYIFIDELDRCRPSYAIELLERVKHLFDIEGIVFVLGVDNHQLANSIEAVYGGKFDATTYLKRFIDHQYRLPTPEAKQFIESQFNSFGLHGILVKNNDPQIYLGLLDTFEQMVSKANLSLRDVEQLVAKFKLVCFTMTNNESPLIELIFFLTFMYQYHFDTYQNYVKQHTTPDDIIRSLHVIFPESEQTHQRRSRGNGVEKLEILLLGAKEMNLDSSPYWKELLHNSTNTNVDDKKRNKAKWLVDMVRMGQWHIPLNRISEKIEMLSDFSFE